MPSLRPQLNVRVDAETRARMDRVRSAASAAVGLSLTYSDLFRMGLVELEKRYPGGPEKIRRNPRTAS